MKTPSWWPWQHRKAWIIGPDVPAVYVELAEMTNVWSPYKRKAIFLFGLGVSVIVMLDIPGLFFTNPYTHIVEGPAAYLGILGGCVVGIMGLMALWAYQYYKDYEVMQFTFGAFILRVRKNLRVSFHALLGTIEKIPETLAEDLKAILDKKIVEYRQVAKIRPIDTSAVKAPAATTTAPTAPTTTPPPSTEIKDLSLFYIPTPGAPIQGVAVLERANFPEELQNPLPGEWIWEGWIRHAKGEIFTLGVLADWQFEIPGTGKVGVIPICAPAGLYSEFTRGLDKVFRPPTIEQPLLDLSKQNVSARVVGLEAVQQLQIYKDVLAVERAARPEMMDFVTETVGNILELITLRNRPGQQPTQTKKPKGGLYVGLTIISIGLFAFTWAAFHGWKLF